MGWGDALHGRHGEWSVCEEKEGHYVQVGRGRSGVGQYVYAQGVHWKYFGFVAELALNMGWLKDNPVHEGHSSYYSRGPNMRVCL